MRKYFIGCFTRMLPLAWVFLLGVLAGCRSVPVTTPILDSIPEYTSVCEKAGIKPEWAHVSSAWWHVFQDPNLNALVETVQDGNSSLRAAWRRLEQSGYAARAVHSQRYPQLNVGVSSGWARRLQSPTGLLDEQDVWGASAVASYELDVWRRVAAATEQADLLAQASYYDYEAMSISLAAAVCEAWFDVNERLLLVSLLRQQLASSEATLAAVEERYRRGLGVLLDVYQQRELMANVNALIPGAESAVHLARSRLSVLLGELPGERSMAVGEGFMPAAPAPVDLDIDAFVAEDRPDVVAALARLGAAERGIALAQRERFPVLKVSVAAGTQADAPDGVFDEVTGEALVGLTLPLVDGGRRSAEVGRAQSLTAERLETYSDTVRQAMREIHDARMQERSQGETVRRIQEELAAATQTLELSMERYRGGLTDYLSVLTAQTRVQRLERTVISARRQQLSYRVQFCRALAGSDVEAVKRRMNRE